MRQLTSLLFLCLALLPALPAQTLYQPNWPSIDARPTPDWWLDAKFGIFIHWGVYSVPAYTTKGNYAEWYQNSLENNAHDGKVRAFHQTNFGNRSYYDLADDFHAELFEPDEWAKLFEKSGAKYVVLTSKHHDGFCLWPSATADKTWGFPWNSVARGPKRDLVGDLFTALEKTSVKPGLYYSLYEWYNPLWKFDHNRYAFEHALPQLHDLVTKYQPWVLWSDGDWDETPDTWRSPQFLAWLYNQSPVRDRIVVNDRWGSGVRFKHAGIYTPEYQPDLDFEDHAWEESRGMGFSYGYNRAEDAGDYNSAQTLVLHLIDKVSRGGNFLLDIGPDAHGKIPPIMQERLLDLGKWMAINNEAIYGSRRWRVPVQWSDGNRNFSPELVDGWKTGGDLLLKQTVNPEPGYAVKEIFYTYNPKTNSLYAIFPKYPTDNRLVLKGIQLPQTVIPTLLDTKEALRKEVNGANTILWLPAYDPNKFKTPYAFAVKIPGFGAYVARPEVDIQYDAQTMRPIIKMSCATPGAVIRYTTDGTTPTEKATAYTQPATLSEARTIRARAFVPGLLASREDSARVQLFTIMPSLSMFRQPDPGLRMQLVQLEKYSAKTLEYGSVLKNAVTQNLDMDPFCLQNKCGQIWKGYFYAPQTSGYQFVLESDDGSVLDLDGLRIVDHDGDHGMEAKSGYAYLQQGWHQLKVLYFNSGGGAGFKATYAPVGGVQIPIPAQALAH
ncbi:MAG: alpha-L-fucosidase [Saprospiraceae bacterium]|nr:alpha-L-fucosidase [Saprospiraceae bacterium]